VFPTAWSIKTFLCLAWTNFASAKLLPVFFHSSLCNRWCPWYLTAMKSFHLLRHFSKQIMSMALKCAKHNTSGIFSGANTKHYLSQFITFAFQWLTNSPMQMTNAHNGWNWRVCFLINLKLIYRNNKYK